MKDIFRGELVRFTYEEPDMVATAEARWQRDTEFIRLADSDPSSFRSEKKTRESFDQKAEAGPKSERYFFTVRTLADDRYIGDLGLWVDLIHSEAWVGLGIGEREFWSKGYGTDIMKVCQRYVFDELVLQRLSLSVFEYNPRALRSYEKCGFLLEGRTRQEILREGKRYDLLWMGILRDEWLEIQNGENL